MSGTSHTACAAWVLLLGGRQVRVPTEQQVESGAVGWGDAGASFISEWVALTEQQVWARSLWGLGLKGVRSCHRRLWWRRARRGVGGREEQAAAGRPFPHPSPCLAPGPACLLLTPSRPRGELMKQEGVEGRTRQLLMGEDEGGDGSGEKMQPR